jgi:dipeptidyl aminopeptidase/acylaminoacyl peptidase
MRPSALLLLLSFGCAAEIRNHPGGQEIPHDRFLSVVPESESPVEKLFIKSRDGMYVAAALRRPKGSGPFPALVYFHGAPGGRGMEQLVGWSLGKTGSPVWERFLQEGFVVVVGDYRGGPRRRGAPQPYSSDEVTPVDDALAIVDHVRALKYVDPARITVYGVSLGGNVVLHLIARTRVHSAVVGAPAAMGFLGVTLPAEGTPGYDPKDRFRNAKPDPEIARRNAAAVECPVLILVGLKDSLVHLARPLYDSLAAAGKRVEMDIYENGYHDFCIGPQGHSIPQPLMDSTLDALEVTLRFVRGGRVE